MRNLFKKLPAIQPPESLSITKKLSDNWFFNIFFLLLLLGMATLPFTNALMLPIAVAMFVNWIAEWNWKAKWQNARKNASLPAIIILLSVYLLVIYGFFLSYNKGRAMAAFDCYMWFLAAPLFMLTYDRKDLTNSHIHMALMIFSLSTFLHLVILFCVALHKYIQTGNEVYFYYQQLSIFRHPSYVAMYATFSFYFLLDFLNKKNKKLTLFAKITAYFIMAVLFLGVFFLQSKAGILVFIILAIVWFIYLMFIRSTDIAAALSIIVVVTSVGIVFYETQWLPLERFKDSFEDITKFKSNHLGSGSSEIRLTVWKSTLEICKKNLPWGVGTGDATDELCVNAVKKNYTNLIGHHFNAHNQYLQTLLTTGIPGLLILVTYCLFPLWTGLRRKNLLYVSFALILILNIIVESMFEVRGGVAFFAIMNVLLLIRSK